MSPPLQKLCLDYDANLASVHSHVEYMFLQNLVRHETQGTTLTWIGGSDAAEEGVWLWSDGTRMNYQIWSPGNPSNYLGTEHCLEMNYDMDSSVQLAHVLFYTHRPHSLEIWPAQGRGMQMSVSPPDDEHYVMQTVHERSFSLSDTVLNS
ncbi:Ladderlectin [Anabarilius grahami]|uniref:Ladderlectin n=1 Tax=Anabarilius grahami TaxID=495550 RepID=A0A3N0YGX0_ANAGA|nr:Ladderlectin [Anabarilius grahami]